VINRHIIIYLKHKSNTKDNQYNIICKQKNYKECKRAPIVLLDIREDSKFCWLYNKDWKIPEVQADALKTRSANANSGG
jgi:hypothetical protein